MAIRKPLAVAEPPSRPLTAEEYFRLPEDDPNRYELFEGMLLMVPPPGAPHQRIVVVILVALREFAQRAGGEAFVSPIGVVLGPDLVFQPDVCFVSRARLRIIQHNIEGAPDIVVEVLSPSTRRFDSSTKLRTYLEAGVRAVWLVDPMSRTVTVHFGGGRRRPRKADFGEPIPSTIVQVGDAGLGELPELGA